MRTSLNEIKAIEDHLFKQSSGEEEVIFQVHLLLNREMKENVKAQQRCYELINAYGRKQFRQEIEEVHQKLFSKKQHITFKNRILALFHL